MAEPEIRQIGLDQLELVEPLWSALREHHASVTPEWGPPRERTDSWARRSKQYAEWLSTPDAFALLAVDASGDAVGYAMVQVDEGSPTWPGGRAAELETLVVRPDARSSGLGERLLEAVYSRLTALDVHSLSLHAIAANAGALRFYERHGFGTVATVLRREV